MLKKLSNVTIWSQDVKNLIPFYRDTLGLKVKMEDEQFAAFGESEDEPGLGLGTHSEVKGKASDPHRIMVGFESDDIAADYRRLSAAGVEFIEQPTEYGGMKIATLKDPEGNLVQLFQWSRTEPAS